MTVWRTVMSSTIPDIPRLLILTFSPRLKGLDQLSMMPLITSASTCWAAKPTMATSREELVKRVALRAFVVVNRPLIQIHAMMDNKTFDMLLKNLMWICSLRFRIIPNILLMANIPALHRPPMTAILMRSISIQTSFPFMTVPISLS